MRPIGAGPVDFRADRNPLEQFGIEHCSSRQVRGIFWTESRVQPAAGIFRADRHWPPVMDIDHASERICLDQNKAGLFGPFLWSPEASEHLELQLFDQVRKGSF